LLLLLLPPPLLLLLLLLQTALRLFVARQICEAAESVDSVLSNSAR